MKCRQFQDNLTDLLAGELSTAEHMQMKRHAAVCPACAAAERSAREALDAVTPRCEIHIPDGMKERILAAALRAENADASPNSETTAPAASRHSRRGLLFRLAAGALSAAALLAVAITIGLNTPARAARNCFRQAVASMSGVRSLGMELRMRTAPQENFAYTNPALDFVPVSIEVIYTPAMMWRVEKPERKAFCDGRQIRQWLSSGDGYIMYPGANVLGDLSLLLDPRTLMLQEEELALTTKGATYKIVRAADAILLTVTCPAQGDYMQSDYMLNSSIAESDTRREYRFDPDNGRLVSARIRVITDRGEREILSLEQIEYAPELSVDRLTARPDGIAWIDLRKAPDGKRLAGIDAKQAGDLILHALTGWDEGILDEALCFYGPNERKELLERFGGAVPAAISEPVRSGEYPGRFIPCKLLLRNGKTQKIMLALRNDTPNGSWVVDGGI